MTNIHGRCIITGFIICLILIAILYAIGYRISKDKDKDRETKKPKEIKGLYIESGIKFPIPRKTYGYLVYVDQGVYKMQLVSLKTIGMTASEANKHFAFMEDKTIIADDAMQHVDVSGGPPATVVRLQNGNYKLVDSNSDIYDIKFPTDKLVIGTSTFVRA
jgi:hypothetical protein